MPRATATPSVEVRRPVVVKVIMTADFRAQVLRETQDAIAQVDRNLGILSHTSADVEVEVERQKLTQTRAHLEHRLREVEGVKEGAELPYRTLEGTVRIRKGDNFLARMGQSEIVLRDWRVVEIRDAAAPPPREEA